jgi:hypothetical protein
MATSDTMAKRRELSSDIKKLIIDKHKAGINCNKISENLHVPKSTIQSINLPIHWFIKENDSKDYFFQEILQNKGRLSNNSMIKLCDTELISASNETKYDKIDS